jgi:anti-sigma factor RsiW
MNRPEAELHLAAHELAGYLDGALPPAEASRVTAHLEACDGCRAEFAAVGRLLAGAAAAMAGSYGGGERTASDEFGRSARPHGPPSTAASGVEKDGSSRRRSRGRWGAGAALLAAGLGALLLAPPAFRGGVDGGADRERAVDLGGREIPLHQPADDALTGRSELRLVWGTAGADAYRVTVAGMDGQVLWTGITTDTMATVPPETALPAGAPFFWYVDSHAGAEAVRSEVRSFRLRP